MIFLAPFMSITPKNQNKIIASLSSTIKLKKKKLKTFYEEILCEYIKNVTMEKHLPNVNGKKKHILWGYSNKYQRKRETMRLEKKKNL